MPIEISLVLSKQVSDHCQAMTNASSFFFFFFNWIEDLRTCLERRCNNNNNKMWAQMIVGMRERERESESQGRGIILNHGKDRREEKLEEDFEGNHIHWPASGCHGDDVADLSPG